MTNLKRVIRPGLMRLFLNKALALVGQNCAIGVLVDGATVMAVGPEELQTFSPESSIFMDLEFGESFEGKLALRPGVPDDFEPGQVERLMEFMTFSLQGFMDQEAVSRSVADEALSKYRELALLHRSVSQFNTSLRLRDVVRSLLNECRRGNHPGEKGALFLNDPSTGEFRLADQFGFSDLHVLAEVKDSDLFRETVKLCKGDIVNDLAEDARWNREIGGVSSLLIAPVTSPNRCEGILLLASEKPGVFQAAHQKSLSTMASVAGIAVSNAFNFEGSQTLMDSLLQALAEAIDSRDPFTAGHSRRVAQLAVAFAQGMSDDNQNFPGIQFSESEIREIYYAGILHDIGKIGIKEDVLTKDSRLPQRLLEVVRARMEFFGQVSDFEWEEAYLRLQEINTSMNPSAEELEFVRKLGDISWGTNGKTISMLCEEECRCLLLPYGNLTCEEREEIQRHPAESERILQHIPMRDGFGSMLTIIRQHHERMDGSGYPDGLHHKDILLQSRMMAIVDIYDAITQERHYKPAATRDEALRILAEDADAGKLDSKLVAFFIDNIHRIEQLADTISMHQQSAISQIEQLTMM